MQKSINYIVFLILFLLVSTVGAWAQENGNFLSEKIEINAHDFGAIPNDGIDDKDELQSAINKD